MKYLKILQILLIYSAYRAQYQERIITSSNIRLQGHLVPRWYSPFFWIYAFGLLPVYLMLYGFVPWLEWIVKQFRNHSFYRCFNAQWDKPTLTKFQQFKIELLEMYKPSRINFF